MTREELIVKLAEMVDKSARKYGIYTQWEMAEAIGVSNATISRLELRKKWNFKDETLRKFADYLRVAIIYNDGEYKLKRGGDQDESKVFDGFNS